MEKKKRKKWNPEGQSEIQDVFFSKQIGKHTGKLTELNNNTNAD